MSGLIFVDLLLCFKCGETGYRSFLHQWKGWEFEFCMLKRQAQHWAGTAVTSSLLLASLYQRSFGKFLPLTLSPSHVGVLVSDTLNLGLP